MESLRDQYAMEVKKIDSVICKRLREDLQEGFREESADAQIKQLYSKIGARIDEILSLFEESFSANEEALREKIERQEIRKRKPRIDKHSQLANQMLKEKIDATIEEIIGSDNCSAIATSVGIDRKTFIDAILDGNIDIDLNRNIVLQKEHEERE